MSAILPVIGVLVVLEPTLSQPEHAITDCCIPVEIDMATCLKWHQIAILHVA